MQNDLKKIPTEELAACLRCSAHSIPMMDCGSCPYAEEEVLTDEYSALADKEVDGKPVAVSCDVDRMALDAAVRLEEMQAALEAAETRPAPMRDW